MKLERGSLVSMRARVRQDKCTGLASFLRIHSVFILTEEKVDRRKRGRTEERGRQRRKEETKEGIRQPPFKELPD